jgi:hypothetical protein
MAVAEWDALFSPVFMFKGWLMSILVAGLLAVAAALVGLARRTAGRPPLWRSKVAFCGAVSCLLAVVVVSMIEPIMFFETPLPIVAIFCLIEGGLALISLRAAAGRPAPKWLVD